MQNRRDYPRHIKRLRAQYREPSEPSWRSCFTHDISVSGVFFESSHIPRAEKIAIEIVLPGEKQVKMTGQLVRGTRVPAKLLRVAKGGFAVRLLEATPDWYEYCLSIGK
jgi:hypothetical protein